LVGLPGLEPWDLILISKMQGTAVLSAVPAGRC
jgi:hypothetical protein